LIIIFIARVPNPSRDGGINSEPPVSAQRITKCRFDFNNHSTLTRPAGIESAPFFAALVANSWCRRLQARYIDLVPGQGAAAMVKNGGSRYGYNTGERCGAVS
jgi:hypothetical protein